MKKLFYLLIIVAGGIYGYTRYADTDFSFLPKKQPQRRLAEPGTYYLLEYVSVKTDAGTVGIIPGQEVHQVRQDQPVQGKIGVSEGQVKFVVDQSQVTDDLDLVDSIRRNDQDSQQRVAKVLAAQKLAAAQRQTALEIARAADVDKMNKATVVANSIGGKSKPR